MDQSAPPVPAPGTPPPTPAQKRRVLVEALGTFAVITVAASLLYQVHALERYFSAIVAALFLYLPFWILGRDRLDHYGFTTHPLRLNLFLVAALTAAVLPLFTVGFVGWERVACLVRALRPLAPAACPAISVGARGWLAQVSAHWALRLPPDFARLSLATFVVVALPEEFFFRGYLQGRLAEIWPARRTLLGAPVGLALVVASALFALCHLAVQWQPTTLAVFFPGLVFGWMRARTGSVLAGSLFHAVCNLYIETLQRSMFG